jgi:FtsP/CotA-like multicopper oxidase with cupredoxin domain
VLALNSANQVIERALPMVMLVVLAADTVTPAPDWSGPPMPTRQPNTDAAEVRFSVRVNVRGDTEWTMNDMADAMDPLFTWAEGDVVDLTLVNEAGPEHPFHLHGQFFQVMSRDGTPVANEPGLKDTVLVPGLESVTVRAYLDNPGHWMAHCHILEHAELGMMAEIEVTPAP